MSDVDENRGSREKKEEKPGTSPYATGGGGITFERRVATKFLAHLLVGDGTIEIGEGRHVVSVAFQQAPDYLIDDLVVSAAYTDESEPSLVLTLAVRRRPKIVQSDESTRKLIRAFVSDMINMSVNGPEYRWGLVVAGDQSHAKQLSDLAKHATSQMDALGFFDLIRTPGKFHDDIRKRLDHLENLVENSLVDLNVTEVAEGEVQQHTWQLLRSLTVSMPRLETPDETDWGTVANSLVSVSRNSNLTSALSLRDKLFDLASNYSAKAAHVDSPLLLRDTRTLIELASRHNKRGRQVLDLLNRQALEAVRTEIVSTNRSRCVCLDRRAQTIELSKKVTEAHAVAVSGEPGVGKSALVVRGLTTVAEEGPNETRVSCMNLRHIPKLPINLQDKFGVPLSELLSEIGAPQRILVVDGADAVVEDMEDAFRYLLDAARKSDVKIVAVTSVDSNGVVQDILREYFEDRVKEHVVAPLTDTEISEIVRTFPELQKLSANQKSRELLRRLVVVDLLVRSDIQDVPLSDADAMNEIWTGLVCRHGRSDRGKPLKRESVMLDLADLALRNAISDERRRVIKGIDDTALDGLCRDGLLRTSQENPFGIGPEFSHDEVRRYAVARLLLADRKPAEKIREYGTPRWSLSAVRLASQVLLAEPNKVDYPLQGRFARMQMSFDALVEAGHGTRWADIPSEALITLSDPSPVLQDVWPGLKDNHAVGLKRLTRLVDQRLRNDNGIIDTAAIEPIIELLFGDRFPWKSGKYAQTLLREWLRGHVAADTAAGHQTRTQFRSHLLDAYEEADRHFIREQEARDAALAARTPEEVERDNRIAGISALARGGRRPRPEIPYEITDNVFLELLALLGPDLGSEGEEILRRVGRDAPSMLAPVVEELFTDRALASYGQGLLAYLTEAYYLDDEADRSSLDDGIRGHVSQNRRIGVMSAWYYGPFCWLFVADFRRGVKVLNRMLNHATRIRVRELSRLHRIDQTHENVDFGMYHMTLEINGESREYFGDENVWRWYRGKTSVGPYPCMSALQALELVCDQKLVKDDISIKDLISVLLTKCESLAMIGFIVGMLIRHLEKSDRLLDPYLTHPVIWNYEFIRITQERMYPRLAADPDGLVARERRLWSFREVAMIIGFYADCERAEELRKLGQKLTKNAHQQLKFTKNQKQAKIGNYQTRLADLNIAQVRVWASSLDRNTHKTRNTSDGLEISTTPPQDVAASVQESNKDLQRGIESWNLLARYSTKLNHVPTESMGKDELEADLSFARKLLENPTSLGLRHSWDVSALIAAAALRVHFLQNINLSIEDLLFATDIILRVGQGEAEESPYKTEFSYFEDGANRSAAQAISLLLLPAAASIRSSIGDSEGFTRRHRGRIRRVGQVIRAIIGMESKLNASESIVQAGLKLARTLSYEVRLHLARGMDHVWQTPCAEKGRCHHDVGWHFVKETIHDCVCGDFDRKNHSRTVIKLNEPLSKSLSKSDGESIIISRLDAAIRALAPAVVANICISDQAQLLLSALLDAQRRALLFHRNAGADDRGSHTLISARALLTLADNGNDKALFTHTAAFVGCPVLLDNMLNAVSAAAEETQSRAATARRIWPDVMSCVLESKALERGSSHDKFYSDRAIASLLPNSSSEGLYLYQEIQDKPIAWWDPNSLESAVEEWLVHAIGRSGCINRLICFIRVLAPEEQIQVGLPWIAKLVLAGDSREVSRASLLPDWLIETRPIVDEANLLSLWQEVIDALVVAGITKVAPYSR